MSQPLEDQTHEEFWQQLLRWLATDTPGRVVASVPSQMLFDDGRVRFSAEVRDKNYLPAADAHVEAHILGPGGAAAQIELTPDPNAHGWRRRKFPHRTESRAARKTFFADRRALLEACRAVQAARRNFLF